jgi:hypothetical protein
MGSVTGKVVVEFDNDRHFKAKVIKPITWVLEEFSITIPAGFSTDGVSVPRISWIFMPHWGHTITRAAMLHDYLIRESVVPSKKADQLFFEAMTVLGASTKLKYLLWLSVRTRNLYLRR